MRVHQITPRLRPRIWRTWDMPRRWQSSHVLHAHIERCIKTEDVSRQMMKNDLDRAMKNWMCTSKEELTGEMEVRSWDETIDNV